MAVSQKIKKIINALIDFGVYKKSGIKFECLGDHAICTKKSKFLKNR
jgi:hypothetical protein